MVGLSKDGYHGRTVSLAVRNLSRVVLLAVCFATVIGLVTGTFLRVLQWVTFLLWETVPAAIAVVPNHPLYTVIVCTVGGITLGLGRLHLGDHPGDVEELLAEIRAGETVDHDEISKGAIHSLVSLAFGASLGPELALLAIGGGMSSHALVRLQYAMRTAWTGTIAGTSTSFSDLRFHATGGLDHPVERNDIPPVPRWWRWIPGLAAIVLGVTALKVAAGSGLHFGYPVPEFGSTNPTRRLAAAALFGALGGFVSVLYLRFRRRLQAHRGTGDHLMRSTVGGLALGFAGAVTPGLLFSGQEAIGALFAGLPLPAEALLVAGVAKIMLVGLMLETGWKGGPIFPLLAGGAATGAALAQIVPGVGSVVGLTAMMAGVPVGELPRPLLIAGTVALFYSGSLFIVAGIGAVAGTIVVRTVRKVGK
ncbi:hypothetical protein GWK26_04280 [haloarchaeon 3A1-DGR]|nr:hypothetical protein GWK26_04280 [haloarchaeon 3A1-DGR]